jgi:hypothetical protein
MAKTRTNLQDTSPTFNPDDEDAYWRDDFMNRDYYEANRPYSDYAPAYRYGWESYSRYPGKKWDQVESDLGRGWDRAKGASSLTWDRAKHAVRDAWHRIEKAIPGDADKDGY